MEPQNNQTGTETPNQPTQIPQANNMESSTMPTPPPKDNKKMMWVVLVVVLVIIVIGILVWVFVVNKPSTTENVTVSENSTIEENNQATQAPASEEINLLAIAPYTGTATATRLFNDNIFTHTVTATTKDPAAGKFYEGWLVKKLPGPPVFFSTGKMVKEGGVYKLTYTSDQNPVGYNQVVITEETEASGLDGKPEAHVFEGDFK